MHLWFGKYGHFWRPQYFHTSKKFLSLELRDASGVDYSYFWGGRQGDYNEHMNKTVMYLFITIGGAAGGYLPVLLGAGGFSVWSILGSTVGGIVGIYTAVKISQ